MQLKQGIIAFLTLGLVLLVGWQALAAPPPLPFARRGMIDRVDLQKRTIVVDDTMYLLPTSVRVQVFHGPARRPQNQQPPPPALTAVALRQGMHIGFNVEGEGGGRKGSIVEAWILMPGSVPGARK